VEKIATGLIFSIVRFALIHGIYYIIDDMTKTLAALAIIVVAIAMAWGIKSVTDRNKATSTINSSVNSEQATLIKEDKIELELISPKDGEVVNAPELTISGKTVANAEVSVDDKETKADKDGNFSVKTTLDEGENEVVVTVNDESGEMAEKSVKVSYESSE